MKKTQWIELGYNIRHTFVSFLAVALLVALAAGLFTGIRWTVGALGTSVEATYTAGRLYHFELSSPYGFDRSFTELLTESGLSEEAEGYYETCRFLSVNGNRYQAKLISLTEGISRPLPAEGVLPEKAGEAAVDVLWARENGIRIGDTLKAEKGGSLNSAAPDAAFGQREELRTDSLRVTALIQSAEYMGRYAETNGVSPLSPAPVSTVIYVAEASFDKEAFPGYPKVAVRMRELDGLMTVSPEYQAASDRLRPALEQAVRDYASRKYAAWTGADAQNAPEDERKLYAYVEPRRMNASWAGIRSVMDTFEKMQYSLVSLFVIIGILVCYSTVSRLVYDQTVLIGTKRALGFTRAEILKPFLIYTAAAVLSGSVLGTLLGRFVIEPVMVASVRETYRFPETVLCIRPAEALLFALLQSVLLLGTALVTGLDVSGKQPLQLLNGNAAASAPARSWPERLPGWRRASLMKKTVILNCLNDRRRVFATLIGVTGCTALVVCALSMYDNLAGSFTLNMDKVSAYDTVIYYSGDPGTGEALSALLEEAGVPHASAFCTQGMMETADGERLATALYATDDAAFFRLLRLWDTRGGGEGRIARGAWINAAYAKNFGAVPGDTLTFTDARGQEHVFPIEGIYEYYLMNYQIILPMALYARETGLPCVPDTVLLRGEGSAFSDIRGPILELEDGPVIRDFYGANRQVFDSVTGIALAVAAVYIALSAVLACLLLLNLFTMFVSEKKTELITLRINGFSVKDAERYISGDTSLLTVIGIAAGIALGIVMGGMSLDSFNNSATCFLNRIDPAACAAGACFTAVMTFCMCRAALSRVKHFSLADINTL